MKEQTLRDLCAVAATAGEPGVVVGYPYEADLDPPPTAGGPPLAFFVPASPLVIDAGRAVGAVVRAWRVESDGDGVPVLAGEWEWAKLAEVEPVESVFTVDRLDGWNEIAAAEVLRLAAEERVSA